MSLSMSLCAVISPRDVLDQIWDLIGSVSEGFPANYFCKHQVGYCDLILLFFFMIFVILKISFHANLLPNIPNGSGGEDDFVVFTINSTVGHLEFST